MSNLKEAIPFAKQYIGSAYILGVVVPKKIPNYKGAFDCAELIAYTLCQVFDLCDYGIRNGDAYTGFFGDDAKRKGKIITVEQAARIPGAILLRLPKPGATGHIVFSQGNGKTVEAHSTKMGVIESVVTGRRWDFGILPPGIDFIEYPAVTTKAPAIVYRYRAPLMKADYIAEIQTILKKKGYYKTEVDGVFGSATNKAVIGFQRSQGLVIDGDVMPGGETARALGI